jgi:hypothetical protein
VLVDESTRAELVGYLSPVPDQPGFVVPLFRRRSANMLLVQEIGLDERVHDFRMVEPRDVQSVDNTARQFQNLGEPALWGFRHKDGTTSFADRKTLQRLLADLMADIERPFLRLQVAQFCEDDAALAGAWRKAFHHLAEHSARSAEAWRDVIVIPAQMRLAVEHAILAHGLDASVERLGRAVEVHVDGGRLQLRLDRNLHAAFTANPAARTALERSAAHIHEAFSLAPGSLSLVSLEPRSRAPTPEALDQDRIVVAAIGDMAFALMHQVAAKWVPEHLPSFTGQDEAESRIVLFQLGEPITSRALYFDQVASIDKDSRIVFVTFQLAEDQRHLLDAAISFAKENRARDRLMIAVIPHLPEELAPDLNVADSILLTLYRYFDAVWALSDRSPHTRQSLAYGPGRSISAVANHFDYLLILARSDRFERSVPKDRPSMALSVISSAVGDRSLANLVGHALMRMNHHLFDFAPVTSAQLRSEGVKQPNIGTVSEIIHHTAPKAKIELNSVDLRDGGLAGVTLALRGIRLLPSGSEHFERFCLAQLDRYGWVRTRADQADMTTIASQRELRDIAIEYNFVAGGTAGSVSRARQRRHRIEDSILLTNTMIRRRTFALHVLNGQVPIHCSRIEAMYRIYRRRYAYVVTYLNLELRRTLEGRRASKLLVPAALDIINLRELVEAGSTSQKLGRAELQADDSVQIDLHYNSVNLSLSLFFTSGRGKNAVAVPGSALVSLDERGWHLETLSAGGREIIRFGQLVTGGTRSPQSEA